MTALVLTSVAMLAGMEVGGNGVDVIALYTLAALVNIIGLGWSAGVAMRFRSLQAAPLMQLPVFLILFFAPVFVPVKLPGRLAADDRAPEPGDADARGGPEPDRRAALRTSPARSASWLPIVAVLGLVAARPAASRGRRRRLEL